MKKVSTHIEQDIISQATAMAADSTSSFNDDLVETHKPDLAGQEDPPGLDMESIETLTKKLIEAESRVQENHEAFVRAAAEADNARRRAQEDIAKAHKFAIEKFAEYLLPVADSLEAALTDTSGDQAKLREGVELTFKQLISALEKGRVTIIDPVGEKFDPNKHQAISAVPSEQEANTVVTVLQKGYLIADRVLRPALVTVAQAS